MIDLIKSFFIPLETKQNLVDLVLDFAKRGHTYTCIFVSTRYPKPVKLWYARELTKYAKLKKVCPMFPFSALSRRNTTLPKQERVVFLEQLKETLSRSKGKYAWPN